VGPRALVVRRVLALGPRAKHVGSNASYGPAGDDALRMSSKIVAKARNYVTLARCQSLQTRAGHFLGRFLMMARELLLPGHDVKFRLRRAGAERADANAVRLHFLGEPFGKKKIEGFCGGIGRNVRNGLEGGSGGEDQDVSTAPGHHVWKKKTCKMNDGRAIDLHHIEKALRVDLGEFTVLSEAGVVDKEFDGKAFLLRERVDFLGRVGLGQVPGKNLRLDRVGFFERLSKSFQTIAATRGKNKVRSAGSELGSKRDSNAGTGSCNQRPFIAPLILHKGIFSSGIGFAKLQHRVFDAVALLFHVVHQAASPDELRSEQGESEEDDQPAGAWSKKHQNAHKQKREARQNFEEATNLLDRTENHRPPKAEESEDN